MSAHIPRLSSIEVLPLKGSKYNIPLEQAEIMVARDQAVWLAGLKVIQEIKRVSVSADNRSWRKTICYDPDTQTSVATMQLVSPRERKPRL
jgi:hypothetical protein